MNLSSPAKPSASLVRFKRRTLHCMKEKTPFSAINWAAIDWVSSSSSSFSLLVLIVARIGERLSFGSRGLAAFITALLFAAGFAVWSYALHDTLKASHRNARSLAPRADAVAEPQAQGKPPRKGRPCWGRAPRRLPERGTRPLWLQPGTNRFARALLKPTAPGNRQGSIAMAATEHVAIERERHYNSRTISILAALAVDAGVVLGSCTVKDNFKPRR